MYPVNRQYPIFCLILLALIHSDFKSGIIHSLNGNSIRYKQ